MSCWQRPLETFSPGDLASLGNSQWKSSSLIDWSSIHNRMTNVVRGDVHVALTVLEKWCSVQFVKYHDGWKKASPNCLHESEASGLKSSKIKALPKITSWQDFTFFPPLNSLNPCLSSALYRVVRKNLKGFYWRKVKPSIKKGKLKKHNCTFVHF